MQELTNKQIDALRAFQRLAKQSDDGPSLMEWARDMGAAYTTLRFHRDKLLHFGLLARTPGKARSMYVTTKGHKALKTEEPLNGNILESSTQD